MLNLPNGFEEAFPGVGDIFPRIFNREGMVFREVADRKTLRFSYQGKRYFLKIHTGVGWKEVFKNLLQFKVPVLGARGEWEALQRLATLRISIPTLVGFGCRGRNPATQHSFVITEDLGESITLEELLVQWNHHQGPIVGQVQRKRELIHGVATIARILHENGINHRDFYLCHLRLTLEDLNSTTPHQFLPIYLMDLHRAQIRKKTPMRWIVKDLGALLFSCLPFRLTRRDYYRFLKVYSGTTLRQVLQTDQGVWTMVQKRAHKMFKKHGAPQLTEGLLTPSVLPLYQ